MGCPDSRSSSPISSLDDDAVTAATEVLGVGGYVAFPAPDDVGVCTPNDAEGPPPPPGENAVGLLNPVLGGDDCICPGDRSTPGPQGFTREW